MRTKFQQQIDENGAEKIKIDLEVEGVKIYGHIDNVYGDNFIYNSVSKSSDTKNKVMAFIYFLLLNAQGKNVNLCFNSLSKTTIIKVDENKQIENGHILNEIMTMVKQGSEKITPFSNDFLNKMEELNNFQNERDEKGEMALIDKALSENPFLSGYIKKEWEAGYFKNPDNRKALLKNLEFVHQNILLNFLTYANI
jgi:exonuclease V gamma subunit